jgi:hypothetical protein
VWSMVRDLFNLYNFVFMICTSHKCAHKLQCTHLVYNGGT